MTHAGAAIVFPLMVILPLAATILILWYRKGPGVKKKRLNVILALIAIEMFLIFAPKSGLSGEVSASLAIVGLFIILLAPAIFRRYVTGPNA